MGIHVHRRRALSIISMICVFAVAFVFAASSAADVGLYPVDPANTVSFMHQGVTYRIGPMAVDGQGRKAYCMETGTPDELWYAQELPIEDSEPARSVAHLAGALQDDDDPLNQAALAVLVHDHLDLQADAWKSRRSSLGSDRPDVLARAERLWGQAREETPVDGRLGVSFTEGTRKGVVNVRVTNAGGGAAVGVPFTLTLKGPAVFTANGKSTIQGTSISDGIDLEWSATGDGTVEAKLHYEITGAQHLISSQDYFRISGPRQAEAVAEVFQVRKSFSPALFSVVPDKVVNHGAAVQDTVISGTKAGDVWASGVDVEAQGYYFDALMPQTLGEDFSETGASGTAYLDELKRAGHTPNAYASAVFGRSGESITVSATTDREGTQNYVAPLSGGFGTWIWIIAVDGQPKQTREFLQEDVVTRFPEPSETLSARAMVAVDSTVTEHSASEGSVISDTISVSGFPDDHGVFAGNAGFGFVADVPIATVSVVWSGDVNDQDKDALYEPRTVEVPTEDAHHRVIGTWEYPARNGVIKVGGGAPDAHGDPVSIVASSHGYYVFVYSFPGDDRAMAVTSAYDDAWERVRVDQRPHGAQPSLTTMVSPMQVGVADAFHDTALVRGSVEEGSYVTFSAYEALEGSGLPSPAGRRIMDEERVPLDHSLTTQTVRSPAAKARKEGSVFWKATLWNKDGDILDAHYLGIDGETTTISSDERAEGERASSSVTQPVKSLARTGVGLLIALAIVVLVASGVGALMVAAIRRRSG